MTTFALLDDRGATPARPTSRLYQNFVREHRATEPAELDAIWAGVEADQRRGLHAVLLADYEWGAKLLKAGDASLAANDTAALRVLIFERLTHLSCDAADVFLAQLEPGEPGPAGAMDLIPSVGRTAFREAIERIHEAIRAGETYQVNYTYRLHGEAHGSPVALYRRLRRHQPVAYGALIALPPAAAPGDGDGSEDGGHGITHVLSCSPELFLRHDAGLLTARPMKGTASRVVAPESDSETARLLSLDVKNRAENLMIVDLMRNDLGRLAQVGSVRVPELFAIEPYATVFQMTSTVTARVRPEVGFPDLLRAVFPCGSITGAPKHHTMALIAALETTPRGLYCGAIGWVDAPTGGARLGNFCLSVAIRTLTLGPVAATGVRPLSLGVGAGIVQDSRADDEFEECRLKARFLTGLDPGFELFETMLWLPRGGFRHRERHLERLVGSARVFGFAFDASAIAEALDDAGRRLTGGTASRVRLGLSHHGRLTLDHAALAPLGGDSAELLLAPVPLAMPNPLAAHKTTLRSHYDAGVRAAERAGAFDSLFFGPDGRLVEGGRSSVFVKLAGRWFTPPVADGALPGVMRSVLLGDPAWQASEATLWRNDLSRAEGLVVCNALRGALPARLRWPEHAPA